MKQITITYMRALTVTVPDDCILETHELVGCVDSMSNADLEEEHGITVVDDETMNFSACTTDIG